MGMTHLLGVLLVLPFSPAARVATASSGFEDAEPLAKKARPWSLLVISWYGVVCRFTPLPFLLFLF
jgi:hypothetical protein